uniref:G-patch domain containing 4 n=1 Tax=Amazona collaria TaxID=241587 RepID=A0A8B9GDC2_9PSIT
MRSLRFLREARSRLLFALAVPVPVHAPGPPAMSAPGPPGRGLLFAESELRRHGWRRGAGPTALRVSAPVLPQVGHDASEPFSFHWWDHVFNQAAANIAVEAGQVRASSTPSLLYGRFVKVNGFGAAQALHPLSQPCSPPYVPHRLTDEELMRVCGGRTAHKGARHGLTMSAKLARLEEQERAFLATCGPKEPPEGQGKKRRRKEPRDGARAEVLQSQEPSEEEEGDEGKAAKRKKKKQEPNGEEEVAGEEGKAARRKKKKQQDNKEEPTVMEKKKPKKQKENKEEPIAMEKKKRKKQKEDKEPIVMEKKKRKKQKEDKEPIVMEKKKRKKQEKENREEPIVMEKKRKKQKEDKEEPIVMEKQQQQDKEELSETEMLLGHTDGPDQARHSPRKKKRRRKKDPE